jgi:hypothetical protein
MKFITGGLLSFLVACSSAQPCDPCPPQAQCYCNAYGSVIRWPDSTADALILSSATDISGSHLRVSFPDGSFAEGEEALVRKAASFSKDEASFLFYGGDDISSSENGTSNQTGANTSEKVGLKGNIPLGGGYSIATSRSRWGYVSGCISANVTYNATRLMKKVPGSKGYPLYDLHTSFYRKGGKKWFGVYESISGYTVCIPLEDGSSGPSVRSQAKQATMSVVMELPTLDSSAATRSAEMGLTVAIYAVVGAMVLCPTYGC